MKIFPFKRNLTKFYCNKPLMIFIFSSLLICTKGFAKGFNKESVQMSVPSAGVMDREIEKDYEESPFEEMAKQKMPDVEIDIPMKKLKIPPNESVEINEIKFTGNTEVSSYELNKVARRYEGKKITQDDLDKLCREVQLLYQGKGYYFVPVYAPNQSLEKGQLLIIIKEGKINRSGNNKK